MRARPTSGRLSDRGGVPLNVLVADDERMSRTLLERTLTRWGHTVVTATNGDEAWAALTAFSPPDLALLNWSMPGIDGPELCRRLRALGQEPYLYVLLLTSRSGRHDVVAGLDAGADDFLSLPLDVAELEARLRAGARVMELQRQLIRARDALQVLALRDPLTGLYNRRAVMEGLDRELRRASRAREPVSVLVLDVDHFKQVNDTYGHFVGDAVLREVATRCLSALRPYDSVGRIGGEEFMVVLPGVGVDLTHRLGERVRQAIAETPIGLPDGRVITLTISVGGAGGPAADLEGAEGVYQSADAALYRAKAAGRNRVALAGP